MRSRSFVEAQLSATLEGNKLIHIQFQMIKYEDLQWVRRFYLHRFLEKHKHIASCFVLSRLIFSSMKSLIALPVGNVNNL